MKVSPSTGRVTFVRAKAGPLSVAPSTGRSVATGADFLTSYAHLFGVGDPAADLVQTDEHQDDVGLTHRTYHQVFGGLPVVAGVLRVHHRGQGFVAANGSFQPVPKVLNTAPRLSAADAFAVAAGTFAGGSPALDDAQLVVVDPGWYGSPPRGARVAYQLAASDSAAGIAYGFFVDAQSGEVLDRWDMLESARDRQVHDVSNDPRRPLPGPLVRQEGGGAVGVADVNRIYDYAGDVYGYYDRGFDRDSLNDRGLTLRATARIVSGCPNAFFYPPGFGLGPQAVFCQGLAADDVVAHEFTHGLTAFSAGLIYQNQSGQLNESFSDVFGETIDLFNGDTAFAGPPGGPPFWPTPPPVGSGTDTPNNHRPDGTLLCSRFNNGYASGMRWLVGEDTTGRELRDMWNPLCFGNPDRVTSPFYTCPAGDNGGVHIGSGVPNHAYALVTDGGTFNGHTVVGIGPIKAGAVWYQALTEYLTPGSDFLAAFDDLNEAADDLVTNAPLDPRTGLASAVFTAADRDQVNEALLAVEMNVPAVCQPAARSYLYVMDTTGSGLGFNAFNNAFILALTNLLSRMPAPTQFAIARFDDYPCLPHGNPGDVPYQLVTPMVPAASIPAFIPVTGNNMGGDTPESQIDAIVTGLTGRALVPQRAGCGPGVPLGQGAFSFGAPRGPTAVILMTFPPVYHLPAPGKPHVNGLANVNALVNVIAVDPGENVLSSIVDIEYNGGVDPAHGADETGAQELLASFKEAGGTGARFSGTTGTELCTAKRACVFLGGGPACLDPGDTDDNGDFLADACDPMFKVCDLNQDAIVTQADIDAILQDRGTSADPPDDPRDIDHDGMITTADAELCTQQCAEPCTILRHYQCYEVKPAPFTGPPVNLVDQLGAHPGVTVLRPDRLCAPADKNDEDPSAPAAADHLEGYRVRGVIAGALNQRVVDQFGTLFLDVTKIDRLLVPTAKDLTATPPAPVGAQLDHFDCYKVRKSRGTPSFAPRTVKVDDQFGTVNVTLKRPQRLCVPADKNGEHPGAETHAEQLLCYKTARTPFGTLTPFTNNQLGAGRPVLIHRTELCVPARTNPPAPTTTTTTSIPTTTVTTTSTTTTTSPPCCEVPTTLGSPLGALCFNAVSPDVEIKCQLLGGTLVRGKFCDRTSSERCELEQEPPPAMQTDWCCECPVNSPPFPHAQYCFVGANGHDPKCQNQGAGCTIHYGKDCGVTTEKCGGSPSGAFVERGGEEVP